MEQLKLSKYVVGDPNKCSGCKACEMACFTEHFKEKGVAGKTVGTVNIQVVPKLYVTQSADKAYVVPVQCKHCEDAPCLNACAKAAISRINSQVVVDTKKCIGCKDCMIACPFGAIALLPNENKGLQEDGTQYLQASKCDMCFDNPNGPACVRVCPNEALRIVDLNVENQNKRDAAGETLKQASDFGKEV